MAAPQSSERLVFFTDAVVAIAITLLVLPLVDAVPEAAGRSSALDLIGDLAPQIASFLLSFVVIARLWLLHHRLFAEVGAVTGALLWWNVAWLLTIVVLPFPTELVGSYDDRAVPLIYIATVLASSICQSAMTLVIRRHGLDDSPDAGRHVGGSLRSTATLAAALVLTLVVPAVGFWSLLLLVAEPWVTRLVRRRA